MTTPTEKRSDATCVRCDGEGRVADTDDMEPWSAWANLPPGSDLAVRLGLITPIPCPDCTTPQEEPVPDQQPTPDVHVAVSSYTISCLPEDHRSWRHYRLVVHRRGDGWVIEQAGEFLAADHFWSPKPVTYTAAEEALAVATAYAPTMALNGVTVAELLARGGDR